MQKPSTSDLDKLPAVPFWRALIGTCSGTSIFPSLLGQSLWRTLFHLLLLMVFMFVILTIGIYVRYGGMFTDAGAALDQRFGALHLSNAGLHPERVPPIAERHFALTENFWFDYYPDKSAYNEAPGGGETHNMGILWDTRMVWYWVHGETGEVVAFPVIAPPDWDEEKNGMILTFNSLDEMRQRAQSFIIADSPDSSVFTPYRKLAITFPAETLTVSGICEMILAFALPMKVFYDTVSIMVMVLLIAAFFAFSTLVFAIPPIRKVMNFRRFFVQMIYTAFPAVVIGTLWSLAGIEFWIFDGMQVTIFGMLIYSFPATFRVQRFLLPPPTPPRHQVLDDDF